jgi:hypothetical protein
MGFWVEPPPSKKGGGRVFSPFSSSFSHILHQDHHTSLTLFESEYEKKIFFLIHSKRERREKIVKKVK